MGTTERVEADPLVMELVGNTDAMAWARAFVRTFEGSRVGETVDDRVDVDLMLGWFANAIMAGHDNATTREAARAYVAQRLRFAQHDADRHLENLLSWIGRKMPRRLRYMTAIGMVAEATTRPELYDFEVPGVTVEQLLPVMGQIARQDS